jgi:tetratricopeptide (TPR) repeat protein
VPGTYEGLKEESLALGARLVKRFPDSVEALDLLASMHNRFGNLAEATRCWHQWLDRNPESAEAYFRLGCFAKEKGRHEEAAEYLGKAFRRAPSLPGVQVHLGESLMALGKMDEAIAVLEADVEETRNNPNRLLLLGHARLQAQRYEKAKEAFRSVVALNPEMTHAYFGLASACAKLGQAEEAKKHYDEFAKRKDREIAGERADVLQNDLPSVRRAVAVWYGTAGKLLDRAGDEDEAEAHWLRAGAIQSADKESRQSLLRLYQRQGRVDRVDRVEEELRKIVSQQGSPDDRKGR